MVKLELTTLAGRNRDNIQLTSLDFRPECELATWTLGLETVSVSAHCL